MSGLSIHHNMAVAVLSRGLVVSGREMGKSMERLSSGYRINAAEDGPAELLQSEKLRSQIAGLEKAIQNAVTAQDMLTAAEGGLGQIQDVLRDMRQYAIHALNSGVVSRDEIAADQARIDSGMQAIERILDSTSYAGRKLLAKITTGVAHEYDARTAGGNDSASGTDNGEQSAAPAAYPSDRVKQLPNGDTAPAGYVRDAVTAAALPPVAPDTADPWPEQGDYKRLMLAAGQSLNDMSSTVIGAVTAKAGNGEPDRTYHLSDIQSWGAASLLRDPAVTLDIINQSSKDIAMQRSRIGAAQRYALDAEEDVLRTHLANLTQAESAIRDTDYAGEMTNFTRFQILQEAGGRLLSAVMENNGALLDLLA